MTFQANGAGVRTVTLYSSEEKRVTAFGAFIPYHVRGPIRAYNSPDIFAKDEIAHVHHLPVERWVFECKEFFIAFDPTLRDIVQSMINSRVYDVHGEYRIKIDNLHHEIKQLRSRTLWDMIRSKFKRKQK